MGVVESKLIISLKDNVSAPAAKVAKALKLAEKQAQALGKAGISDRLSAQLSHLGASSAVIGKVGAAWRKYAADSSLAANASHWTTAQVAKVRTWENATISSIRGVIRAEQLLERQQRRMAARAVPVPIAHGHDHSLVKGIAGTSAAYAGKRFAKRAFGDFAEFDIGVRKQREFVDIPKDVQERILVPQAKRIGQDTQFTNLDVVRAQTKAMQGLPASFDAKLRAEVGAGILENVRNYALVMEADLETSAEAIRSFLQSTNKDISSKSKALAEANRATNLMVRMAKLGGMSDEDVQQYMRYGAATGTAAKLSDTTIAAIGSVGRRAGLRGDQQGVFLRSISSKLVAPTGKGLDALTAAGIDYNKYTKMPGGMSAANLDLFTKRRFGKGLNSSQIDRLDEVLDDSEIVDSREKFVEAVSPIIAESFGKDKKGKTRAQDAKAIAKMAASFHKLSVESVDTEGLLNEIMSNPKMTIALLNALFTDKQGGKASILATNWDQFKGDKAELQKAGDDPDFAKRKADEIMAGFGGALERAKGSIENFTLSIGQANEGLARFSVDAFSGVLDALSNLPDPLRRFGSEVAAVAGVVAGLKGLEALYGGFGLKTSAVALDGSAAALTRAAVALGATATPGVPGAPAGPAGPAGGTRPSLLSLLYPYAIYELGKMGIDYLMPPNEESKKSTWTRASELVNRTFGKLPDGKNYKRDFTLGYEGGFSKEPSIVPPNNMKHMTDWNASRVAPGPMGQNKPVITPVDDTVFTTGSNAVQNLDQSQAAGAAGSKTGSAFKQNMQAELNEVDAMIRAKVQAWAGMLSFSASPSITPKLGAPGPTPKGDPRQQHSSANSLTHARHAAFADGVSFGSFA